MALKNTKKRRLVLGAALSRAKDEWEAELSDYTFRDPRTLEPYEKQERARLENDLDTLKDARILLRERGLL
jgi:hypothetical protein